MSSQSNISVTVHKLSHIPASMGLRFSYSNFTNTEAKNKWEWGWNKFFKFIVERVTQSNLYNAPLFNLIWVISENDAKTLNNKMFAISKINKHQRLKDIMMDTE